MSLVKSKGEKPQEPALNREEFLFLQKACREVWLDVFDSDTSIDYITEKWQLTGKGYEPTPYYLVNQFDMINSNKLWRIVCDNPKFRNVKDFIAYQAYWLERGVDND